MDYIQYFQSIPIPPITQAPNAQRWWAAYGKYMNDIVTLILNAAQVAYPDFAPSDALSIIADEVGLLQGISESNASFILRLKAAYTFGTTSGTALGLLLNLHYQGLDGYLIQQNGLWSKLNNNTIDLTNLQASLVTGFVPGNNSLIKGNPPYFSIPIKGSPNDVKSGQFYPVIPNYYFQYTLPRFHGVQQNNRFILYFDSAPSVWGGGIPTTFQLDQYQNIINIWKPSKSIFAGIIVRNSGQMCNIPVNQSVCGSSLCGGSGSIYISNYYTTNGV
jgi:hypothetical protein